MAFEPQGKVAVVTGAAGGIGLGMARAFVDAGMRVVLSDVDADRVEASAASLRDAGHDAVGVRTDVSDRASVAALAEAAMDTYGRVDVLCNNAGVAMFAKIAETTIEDWEWTLGVGLWGPIHGIKTFLPLLDRNAEGGHINSTASVAGLIAAAAAAPYNVAKHGVVALMATLERELRSSKSLHRASVLCPGAVNTGIGANSVRQRRAVVGTRGQASGPPSDTIVADGAPQVPIKDGSQSGKKLGDKMSNALSRGMQPDDVGRLVLDAILTDKFWIFTDPSLLRVAQEQLELSISDRLLSRGRLV